MWLEQWQDSPRRTRMELVDKTFPFKEFERIRNGLTRAQSSLLLQIRSGHIPLNAHLFRLQCVDSDKCQACATRRGVIPTKETVAHFLFECPAYRYERHDLDRALGRHSSNLESILADDKRTRQLLRYVGRTGRLKKPFGDVAQQLSDEDF